MTNVIDYINNTYKIPEGYSKLLFYKSSEKNIKKNPARFKELQDASLADSTPIFAYEDFDRDFDYAELPDSLVVIAVKDEYVATTSTDGVYKVRHPKVLDIIDALALLKGDRIDTINNTWLYMEVETATLKALDFSGCTFVGSVFDRVHFCRVNLESCEFAGTLFRYVGFEDVNLDYVTFLDCSVRDSSFHRCLSDYTSFTCGEVVNSEWSDTSLRTVSFHRTNVKHIDCAVGA